MGANDKVTATFHGMRPLAAVKRLVDSLVVLAAAREAAGWQRIASVDEIAEISTALQAIDVNLIKAQAVRELAQAQRQLAADARTSNGQAEHEDIADWLDEQAAALEPVLEGTHP